MKKGDIYVVNLFVGIGHEQHGYRPAILFSKLSSGMAIVIPLTTNIEALSFAHSFLVVPTRQNRLAQESVALIFQMKSVDRNRFGKKIGHVDKVMLQKMNKIMKEFLEID